MTSVIKVLEKHFFRYAILAAEEASAKDPKTAGEKMMKKLEDEKKIDAEEYRIGFTKVIRHKVVSSGFRFLLCD